MTTQWLIRLKLFITCVLFLSASSAVAGAAPGSIEWRPAYLTSSTVLDITIGGNGEGWAVGEAGTILHYDGESWRSVESPTDKTLHAVTFASAGEGWAVGKAGTILRHAGANWHRVSAPTTAVDELFDVALTGGGDGWAVGRRFNTVSETFEGLILRLSDDTWTDLSVPQIQPLHAVAFASTDDGWAIGEGGTVLRWDGVRWTEGNSPTTVDLHDVAVVGSDVWAVGDQGVRVYWGLEGSRVDLIPYDVPLTGVAFASPDAGWIVGADGTILHYDGRTWESIELSFHVDLFGLFIEADGTPWVTGDGGLIGYVTVDGWQLAAQPYVDVNLTAIDMVSTAAGWAVGSEFSPSPERVIFWQRGAELWDPHEVRGAPPLFDIAVLSENEAWAVGAQSPPSTHGAVWHYSAGRWTAAGDLDVSALFAVEAVGPDDVWAAGQDGSLAHYGGSVWQEVPAVPLNVHLYDLHFRASNDGWAVGERLELEGPPRYTAVAFHYDGATWQEAIIPDTAWEAGTDSRLLAVYSLSENDVWAAGDQGAILHYDGVRWATAQGKQNYDVLDIDFAGPGDGWAVGTQGVILRLREDTWIPMESPTEENLTGVVSRPRGEAWAVGNHGVFLYHPAVRPNVVYMPLVKR